MSDKIFTDVIYWPNGRGETPCTKEYKALCDEQDDLRSKYTDILTGIQEFIDDWSLDDYNRFHQLANDIGILQIEGHLGESIRYAD